MHSLQLASAPLPPIFSANRPFQLPFFTTPIKNLPFRLRRQTCSATSIESVSPQVESLWEWLWEQKVVTPKCPVRPGSVPEGLGLIAQRDIARNETVLELPKKLWINPDMVSSSEIGSVCRGLKPWVSVALFMIREKSKVDSFWKPYIDVLPGTTDSTVFWSEEELSELQGTQLSRTTRGLKEFLKREFSKLEEEVLVPHKHLFPCSITLTDFTWAFAILRSRSFSRLKGENLLLVPLADLINHNPDITTEDHGYDIKGAGIFSRDMMFCLRSPLSVKAGEQVMIQYDLQKSNAELAMDYGFIETRPDRNTYTLTLQISESDPFVGDKLDIAEENGLGETADFDVILGNPLPPSLLPYLRLVALGGTDAFLLESIFRNTIWEHLQQPVSRDNEELICRVVQEACNSAMSQYPTTIEEDEAINAAENLHTRQKIAVEVRLGEKKVLQQIIETFRQRELKLEEMEYYQERRLKDLGLVGEQGEIIFWES